VATMEMRRSTSSLASLFRRATMLRPSRMRALSAKLFIVALFAVGCGANSGNAVSTSDDQPGETRSGPQKQEGPTAGQKPKVLSASNQVPKRRGPQSIPGMDANAVLITFLKPGLECWQPTDRYVLYLCGSEENQNLTLLYEGKIMGLNATDQVSGVEAHVFRRGAVDFERHSQSFLSFLATQLKYRGANKERAYEFVNDNLSGNKTTITIGEATWTMTSSDSFKELTIRPA
jgi:hypothetical protein